MPITETPAAPADVRNMEAGLLAIALGAILLLISLFLEWFEPGIEAWDVFEVWDLVLAALAIAALVAVAGRLGYAPPRPNSWLVAAGVVTFVVVVAALLDPPPLVDGAGHDPSTGLWLALVASVLMLAGTALSVARISVALNIGDSPVGAPRRFGRGARVGVDPEYPAQPPVAPTPAAPVAGTPPPPPPLGGTTPTEPTRRL